MQKKRILAIILIIFGLAFLGVSFYIKSQVKAGRELIKQAETTVEQGKQLFSMTPATKEVGKQVTKPVEKKIEEGSQKADRFDRFTIIFMIVGAMAIAIGVLMLYKTRKKPGIFQ